MGAKFSIPIKTGPGAHPAPYNGYWVFARGGGGVKQPGRGTDHPPPSSVEAKETVELYMYSPSGFLWPVVE